MARVGFEFVSDGICGRGKTTILLAGHDITSVVTRVQIDAEAMSVPRVTIDVIGTSLEVLADVDHVDLISKLVRRDGSLDVQAVTVSGKDPGESHG